MVKLIRYLHFIFDIRQHPVSPQLQQLYHFVIHSPAYIPADENLIFPTFDRPVKVRKNNSIAVFLKVKGGVKWQKPLIVSSAV